APESTLFPYTTLFRSVDVEKRVVLPGGVVLLQGDPHRLVVAPALEDAGVVPAERLEQNSDALLALAVDTDADIVTLVDFELEPRSEEHTSELQSPCNL